MNKITVKRNTEAKHKSQKVIICKLIEQSERSEVKAIKKGC